MRDATNDEWLQYKVTLASSDGANTPTVSQVQVGYIREISVIPVVTTNDSTSVTATGATLNGNITGTGGTDVTVRGFAYGSSATLSTVIATTTDTTGQPFGAGSFTGAVANLTCGTVYYARAYATNSAGTGFGSLKTIATTNCSTNTGGSGTSHSGSGRTIIPATIPPIVITPVVDPHVPPRAGGGGLPTTISPPVNVGSAQDNGQIDESGQTHPTESPVDDAGAVPIFTSVLHTASNVGQTVVYQGIAAIISATKLALPAVSPVALVVSVGALAQTLFPGIAVGLTASSIPTTSEILYALRRCWNLLLTALGFRKRRPWGVVYDSITKHPLDPASIKLTDEYGKTLSTSYTDLDGRYGFLVGPGTYHLEVNKKNYIFPSEHLANKLTDEVYTNLYFGGPVITTGENATILNNIPLDPVNLEWGEFTEQNKKRFRYYSERDRILSFFVLWLFRFGFLTALYAVLVNRTSYNLGLFSLYILVGGLRLLGFGPRPYGSLTESRTGNPLSYALVVVRNADIHTEVARIVADRLGRYYALVSDGRYVVDIKKKEPDESYTFVYTSPVLTVKGGIIKQNFRI